MRALPSLLLLLVVAACSGATPPASIPPAASPTMTGPGAGGATPSPTQPADEDPIAALVRDLRATGVEAHAGDEFVADPLSRRGVVVCVAGEAVQVYIFDTPDQAAAQAAMIDPRDPSNVGTAMIEWAGEPKFWLREELLVLYLGNDQAAADALLTVLGEPFAIGRGRPPLLPDDGC